MSSKGNFADTMAAWAASEPSVKALVLFGSQVRPRNEPIWSADAQSDWDFQIITSRPQNFLDSKWLLKVADVKLKAFAVRKPRVGAMPKVNVVLDHTEADFVIIPAGSLHVAKFGVKLGLHNRSRRLRRALQDLAIVIRPGFRFLKGGPTWEPFYRTVINDVPDLRIEDAEVRNLAEGFVCDYIWALRKLERGELIAVQRMLHRELAETNFKLLHELRLRNGEPSAPDARRLERVTKKEELTGISVNAVLDVNALQTALAQSAKTLGSLVRALVNETWRWPDV